MYFIIIIFCEFYKNIFNNNNSFIVINNAETHNYLPSIYLYSKEENKLRKYLTELHITFYV